MNEILKEAVERIEEANASRDSWNDSWGQTWEQNGAGPWQQNW